MSIERLDIPKSFWRRVALRPAVLAPLALLPLALLGLVRCASEPKAQTVGVVHFTQRNEPLMSGFKAALQEAGYTEGQHPRLVESVSNGEINDLDSAVRQVLAADPDMIFVSSTPATLKVKELTAGSGVPVVFARVTDPVASGIVQDLRNPSQNITGVRLGGSNAKALDWLTTAAPSTSRVYVPHNPEDAGSVQALEQLREAAPKLGVELVVREVDSLPALEAALNDVPADVDALFLLGAGFLVQHADLFGQAAISRRLPLGTACPCDNPGILVSYAQDNYLMGQQAGRLAARILKGANPGELPVETPHYLLSVNMVTAQAIGFDLPRDMLLFADRVVRSAGN